MTAGVARRLVLAALPAMLAGCGFQPVYMPTASGKAGPAEREMATVEVAQIPERPGQLLRIALQSRLNSDGGGLPKYELRVYYWITAEGIAIQPDNSVTRARITAYANWSLLSAGVPQRVVTSGHVRAQDAMNLFDSQYFAMDLENETIQRRFAERMANDITMQLAIWFRRQAAQQQAAQPAQPPPAS